MSIQAAWWSRIFADVGATRPLRPRVPVLAYRSLDERGTTLSTAPETFRRQMKWLAIRGWHTLGVDALLAGHAAGGWHERAFVLTFDDGYRNFGEHALPLLRAYGFNALVFVVVGHVGRAGDWRGQPAGAASLPLMDWDELRALTDAGIQVGAHSLTHPCLTSLAPADAEREIVASKETLEARVEQPVVAFAYPRGASSAPLEEVVARHFRVGFGTRLGYASPRSRTTRFERIDMHTLQSTRLFGALDRDWLGAYLRARQSLRDLRARVA